MKVIIVSLVLSILFVVLVIPIFICLFLKAKLNKENIKKIYFILFR